MSVTSSCNFSLVSWFTQAGNRLAGVLAGLTGDVYRNCPEIFKIIQVYFCIFFPSPVTVVPMQSPLFVFDNRWSCCMRNRTAHSS